MNPPTIINLWPDGSKQNPADPNQRPRLEVYLPEGASQTRPAKRLPAIIVLPGGGYANRAPHEGAPFAQLFAAHGFVSFVCHYRVAPHRFPAPMADAARAVRLTRHLAGELGIDPQRIALMGFSAGGHLACTTGTQPDLYREPEDDLAGRFSARPDRLILAYPVVSMTHEYHHGSAENLLGPDPSEAQRRQMSNELHVTKENPPVFLFHTADDPAVPVSNSIRYAQACLEKGAPVELHVYRSGRHGVGLALEEPTLRSWTGLLLDWLKEW
jgi:acetyl esterase/lipase